MAGTSYDPIVLPVSSTKNAVACPEPIGTRIKYHLVVNVHHSSSISQDLQSHSNTIHIGAIFQPGLTLGRGLRRFHRELDDSIKVLWPSMIIKAQIGSKGTFSSYDIMTTNTRVKRSTQANQWETFRRDENHKCLFNASRLLPDAELLVRELS